LQIGHAPHAVTGQFAQGDAHRDAQQHPSGEVLLEETDGGYSGSGAHAMPATRSLITCSLNARISSRVLRKAPRIPSSVPVAFAGSGKPLCIRSAGPGT